MEEHKAFPLEDFLKQRKACGEFIADKDYGQEADGTDGFDEIAERCIHLIETVLESYHVPAPDTERYVIHPIRTIFQAQILYLRRCIQRQRAYRLYWENPEKLVRDRRLMVVFEEFLKSYDPQLAATAINDLRRRYPLRPVLVKR